MLRMLIADDEKIIRETIQSFIDWKSLDIEIVGICKNGLEAYDMILDENPDIVLTDIKMPGLSGIELIQQIRQVSRDVQFIILSGYDDFNYAKSAMAYGVQFYMLKPCNEKEIIQAIETVKKICLRRVNREIQYKGNLLILKKLQESVILRLLNEKSFEHIDLDALKDKYENMLDFKNVEYQVCCFQNLSKQTQADILLLFNNYLNNNAQYVVACYMKTSNNLFIGFESYDYDYTNFDIEMNKYLLSTQKYFRQTQKNLTEMISYFHLNMKSLKDIEFGIDENMTSIIKDKNLLYQAPVDTCVSEIQKIVRENIFDPELSLKKISESHLYMNVDYLSRKFLKVTGVKFSAFLANERIKAAKQLFELHPTWSINAVAESVGCGNNPQYFSQLFKKHVGITASEYLKNIK